MISTPVVHVRFDIIMYCTVELLIMAIHLQIFIIYSAHQCNVKFQFRKFMQDYVHIIIGCYDLPNNFSLPTMTILTIANVKVNVKLVR
jgi:hypothetical protein